MELKWQEENKIKSPLHLKRSEWSVGGRGETPYGRRPLCRLRYAPMRQISSVAARLIFDRGNTRAGKSGAEISMDVWAGYL